MADELFSIVGLEDVSLDADHQPQCTQLNVSMCHFTEGEHSSLLMAVYNPVPRSRDVRVRVPVPHNKLVVLTDYDGTELEVQLVPIRDAILNYVGRNASVDADYEAWFVVPQVPAMGEERLERKDETDEIVRTLPIQVSRWCTCPRVTELLPTLLHPLKSPTTTS